ncbi:hypothetical protein PHLGIDRAFT_62780 [Phlebiopsis gigantea 11061_1 CR5-6]|uniref:Transmembrane protein 135 N-terminal domain-containing protein n=1 Tax=Phlebiopsis gigantea (strain 11061_1 CR5-6) TaxID=745531 RepID=A0A0C3SDL9_PHLG1|nr:hypothetical protein PHLGIDRAFT_62780 [Phlebiopsis gigantea 11061_1 CR5-6]
MHHRQRRTLSVPGTRAPQQSHTLGLTLLVSVRAMDAVVRSVFFPPRHSDSPSDTTRQDRRRTLAARLDAFVFWAASARIMWCFFYEPQRLPRSYNTWIMKLANIDPRILGALRALREGRWSYISGLSDPVDLGSSLSRDLGYPSAWGDPARLPSHGGPSANATWEKLGVTNRMGLGGLPCELIHGGIAGGSCTGNAVIRGTLAFAEAMLIYVPVHVLPILLTKPHKLTKVSNLLQTLFSAVRSASFLSSFVSSIWISVCLTRTVLLARMMPWISHDFWDGPYGCAFLGTLVCGSTIWIEQGKRRGEMALYVLPRAIRACLPETLLASRRRIMLLERLVFATSLATLLTAYTHKPEALRGLSRWALSFVMNGPNAGFWKKKRQDHSASSTLNMSPSHSHQSTDDV